MSKHCLAFLLLLPVSASAGQIRPFDAFIAGREVSAGKSLIEYCELGRCRPLSNDQGYSDEQWADLREICSEYSIFGSTAQRTVSTIMGYLIVGSKLPGGLKGIGLGGLFLFDEKVAENEASLATDVSKGLLAPEQNFNLTLDDFIALRNGIEKCAQEYAWRQSWKYKIFINGWARPLG